MRTRLGYAASKEANSPVEKHPPEQNLRSPPSTSTAKEMARIRHTIDLACNFSPRRRDSVSSFLGIPRDFCIGGIQQGKSRRHRPNFRHQTRLSGDYFIADSEITTRMHSSAEQLRDTPHMADGEQEILDGYVKELIDGQGRLRAFILAALGNYANASDVLQRTNMVLWKKAHEFRPGAEFMPWALTVARYEVLAFMRDRQRDRHVFAEDVTTLMLDAAAEASDPGDRIAALRNCLQRLRGQSRNLLWQRYSEDKSIKEISAVTGRSEDSVKSHLLRVRKKLEQCIESFMKTRAA
jgi:RNA polymerase sigma-70 factor (ECF subfamily)